MEVIDKYLGLFVVFCCFGHLNNQTNSLTLEIFNPQAFEAIASSSGGIQTLIDACLNQDVKITTIRKWKLIDKITRKVKFWLRLFYILLRHCLWEKLYWILHNFSRSPRPLHLRLPQGSSCQDNLLPPELSLWRFILSGASSLSPSPSRGAATKWPKDRPEHFPMALRQNKLAINIGIQIRHLIIPFSGDHYQSVLGGRASFPWKGTGLISHQEGDQVLMIII